VRVIEGKEMSKEVFRYMVARRNQLPIDLLQGKRVKCLCGLHTFNSGTASPQADEEHWEKCKRLGGRIHLHDGVVMTIHSCLRGQGIKSVPEPFIHKDANNRRLDLRIENLARAGEKKDMLDVSTAGLSASPGSEGPKSLVVAKKREQMKHKKYSVAMMASPQYKLVPFVIESPTGALGLEATAWLRKVADRGGSWSNEETIYRDNLEAIMHAFHHGNAVCAYNLADEVLKTAATEGQ
jgi:hypothetical protein